MTNVKLKKRSEGFTIIEVLIVLAIAGLIMLIVFLAVPALQRNSRNTQRKADVSALLGAWSEFQNNNNGSVPTGVSQVSGSSYNVTGSTGTSAAQFNLGFFNTVTPIPVQAAAATAPTLSATAPIYVLTGAVCSGNAPTTTGATNRNVVVYFAIEPGYTPQCQAS